MKKANKVESRELRVESQKAHTPGPWHTGHIGEDEYRREMVFDSNSGQVAECLELSNAKFIVRACNSHDELLEAVKACLPIVEYFNEREGCPQTLRTVHAAITKAEGAEDRRTEATPTLQGDAVKIAVEISGGCLSAVHSSVRDTEVTLIDWDNAKDIEGGKARAEKRLAQARQTAVHTVL